MKKLTLILLFVTVGCQDDELNFLDGLYLEQQWNYHFRIFDEVKNGNLFVVNPNYRLEDIKIFDLIVPDITDPHELAVPWYWKNEPLILIKYPPQWELKIDYGNGDADTLLIIHEPEGEYLLEKIIYYLNGKYHGEYKPPDGDWDYYFRRNGGWYYTLNDPNYAFNNPDYDPIIFTLVKTDAIQ